MRASSPVHSFLANMPPAVAAISLVRGGAQHAAANLVPVVAANRIGVEAGLEMLPTTRSEDDTARATPRMSITFYGTSFICDATGAVVADAGREGEAVLLARFDRAEMAAFRRGWGLFRDRRPELYRPLLSLDGGSAAGGGTTS
jgi:N-carbamoylputrescine amidase